MGVDCTDRHVCEPENYPTELGQTYRCDMCGAKHYAFDVLAAYGGNPLFAKVVARIKPGTLGWTTTKPAPTQRVTSPEEGEK